MANDNYWPKTQKEFNAYRKSKEQADADAIKSAKETEKRLKAQGLTVKGGKVVPISKKK